MKLGIMQPYFLPYLGYFQLMDKVDIFVLLDEVQFIRHGWIERNRILNSNEGWQYIKVPLVKHSRDTLIKDVMIRTEEDWVSKILAQLTCYKNKAPFYHDVVTWLEPTLREKHQGITGLNFELLKKISDYFGLKTKIEIYSNMNCSIDEIRQPGDWALEISKASEADYYINPLDGKKLFDITKFKDNNICLKFLRNELPVYSQRRQKFESGLSILDVMMFCDKDQVRQMLSMGEIVS